MPSTKSAPAKSVDAYLAAVPADQRATLEKLRKAIKAAAPKAEEKISYRIPVYTLNGHLVAFGAAKQHCSFFVMSPAVMKTFKDELKGYDQAKGTVRFPIGKPLPAVLVKKIVQARIAENDARKKTKKR